MISAQSTRFEFFDRGKKETAVLIPGWATDYRIFDNLNLDFNYLLPVEFNPINFKDKLHTYLKDNGITDIWFCGYSLGGFIASGFAEEHPDIVKGLVLMSIRERYESDEIEGVRRALKKNKDAYLYKFYSQCLPDDIARKFFKKTLLKDYLKKFELKFLLDTLEFLKNCRICPEALKGVKRIKIIHGREDRIAPLQEVLKIKNDLEDAELTLIDGAGHMVFFGAWKKIL
ncbi:MAG: alpha/beta hydrolase [Candidatus Omnitrophica bacterium]|nr:alpha/beta hydrolase [Candidatus Omnitrophota bacterium]